MVRSKTLMLHSHSTPVFHNICHLQVQSVNFFGPINVMPEEILSLRIGPQKSYKKNEARFSMKNSFNISKQWSFSYKRADSSSIYISIYKCPIFGESVEIARATVFLGDFAPDYVTIKKINLVSLNGSNIGSITIRIHLNEDESEPFCAPLDVGRRFDNIQVFAPRLTV